MSSNLIQNYIASKPQQNPIKQDMPDFNIQHELDNRTFIKPLTGSGELLSGNIFSSPKQFSDSFVYKMKALKHAAKGKANDHELGKINDIGLVAGGLAIATYLFTKRTTNMTKGMEFIGLGSFLASMALWPVLAIQLPAYLIHGVNVKKKYKDSFGRVKPFYQDPQFIPWDLYSDKEINKIGDRLGVPKNIPNRRDFIQEKMKKIAVQNNTLWMLTAGFATPIMSALICNMSEPYLLKHIDEKQNKKADKILSNLEDYSKKYKDNAVTKDIEEIIKNHSGTPINKEIQGLVFDAFTRDMDAVSAESFRKDLTRLLSDGRYSVNEESAKEIVANLKTQFAGKDFSKEFLEAAIPSEEEIINLLKEKELLGKSLKPVEFVKVSNAIANKIAIKVHLYNAAHVDDAEDMQYIRKLILNNKSEEHPIIKALLKRQSSVLNEDLAQKLKNLAGIFDNFRAKNFALDEYALIKTGAAPETVIANYWNKVSNDFLKTLGVKQKELEKVRFDENLMGELLRDKIEKIVSDEKSYNRVMTSLAESIASINKKLKPSDITSHMLSDNVNKTAYETAVDSIFENFATQLRESGFERTARAIAGNGEDAFGTYRAIQKAFAEERILGVKSSFYRLLNTLDFYHRVANDPNGLKSINGATIAREVKEELIELCKIITLSGHSSDFATKFYMKRNPHPNLEDISPIEIMAGKVKNKYYGKAAQTTDIPNDKYFYQNAMNYMFGGDMSPETKAILDKFMIGDEVAKYRQLVFKNIGGEKYFYKPRHRVANTNASSNIKFLLTGISPQELFFKSGQQLFNTRKWLSIFGKFGAGLLGITVLAQFFFGHLKVPKGGKNA